MNEGALCGETAARRIALVRLPLTPAPSVAPCRCVPVAGVDAGSRRPDEHAHAPCNRGDDGGNGCSASGSALARASIGDTATDFSVRLNGTMSGNTVTGTISRGGQHLRFRMTKRADLP